MGNTTPSSDQEGAFAECSAKQKAYPQSEVILQYIVTKIKFYTYDHRLRQTGYPVRSAVLKTQIDRLVVGWVTTSESRLLYVFAFLSSGLLFCVLSFDLCEKGKVRDC